MFLHNPRIRKVNIVECLVDEGVGWFGVGLTILFHQETFLL